MILLTDCKSKAEYSLRMAKLEIDLDFANRFSELVKSKGWGDLSRVELGKKLGVSSTCAHFYMRGERLPAIDQARMLCKLFDGISIEWLLTGNGLKRLDDKQQTSPLLDKFNQLCPEQQKEVTEFINFKLSQNKENKPLTARPENGGGGGVNLPDALSAYHRRQSDGPASKEFCDAVQQDYEDSK
jgi:DNA-binding XRE family transcriptional regulator